MSSEKKDEPRASKRVKVHEGVYEGVHEMRTLVPVSISFKSLLEQKIPNAISRYSVFPLFFLSDFNLLKILSKGDQQAFAKFSSNLSEIHVGRPDEHLFGPLSSAGYLLLKKCLSDSQKTCTAVSIDTVTYPSHDVVDLIRALPILTRIEWNNILSTFPMRSSGRCWWILSRLFPLASNRFTSLIFRHDLEGRITIEKEAEQKVIQALKETSSRHPLQHLVLPRLCNFPDDFFKDLFNFNRLERLGISCNWLTSEDVLPNLSVSLAHLKILEVYQLFAGNSAANAVEDEFDMKQPFVTHHQHLLKCISLLKEKQKQLDWTEWSFQLASNEASTFRSTFFVRWHTTPSYSCYIKWWFWQGNGYPAPLLCESLVAINPSRKWQTIEIGVNDLTTNHPTPYDDTAVDCLLNFAKNQMSVEHLVFQQIRPKKGRELAMLRWLQVFTDSKELAETIQKLGLSSISFKNAEDHEVICMFDFQRGIFQTSVKEVPEDWLEAFSLVCSSRNIPIQTCEYFVSSLHMEGTMHGGPRDFEKDDLLRIFIENLAKKGVQPTSFVCHFRESEYDTRRQVANSVDSTLLDQKKYPLSNFPHLQKLVPRLGQFKHLTRLDLSCLFLQTTQESFNMLNNTLQGLEEIRLLMQPFKDQLDKKRPLEVLTSKNLRSVDLQIARWPRKDQSIKEEEYLSESKMIASFIEQHPNLRHLRYIVHIYEYPTNIDQAGELPRISSGSRHLQSLDLTVLGSYLEGNTLKEFCQLCPSLERLGVFLSSVPTREFSQIGSQIEGSQKEICQRLQKDCPHLRALQVKLDDFQLPPSPLIHSLQFEDRSAGSSLYVLFNDPLKKGHGPFFASASSKHKSMENQKSQQRKEEAEDDKRVMWTPNKLIPLPNLYAQAIQDIQKRATGPFLVQSSQ
jgi:hypothetical protein